MEYDDITSMLKQIADLKTYAPCGITGDDPMAVKRGWQAALDAMEYWCQRNLEHKRGRG